MKSVPRSVPPPVPQDCIVFGHCAYDFDGTEYGHEYLVLSRSEVVVYLNQEDQQWLLGRRACWKNNTLHHPNNTLHHPNSDGSLLLGWFPASCVTSWTIWRPEPNHAVRALRGFFRTVWLGLQNLMLLELEVPAKKIKRREKNRAEKSARI